MPDRKRLIEKATRLVKASDPTRTVEGALLRNIRAQLPELRSLLEECDSHWGSEDLVYRFYHQSFKVYAIQDLTDRIVAALTGLLPDRPLNQWFATIIGQGTGKDFRMSHNQRWLPNTRPLLEAYWHARYMLGMAVRYGEELEAPPEPLPSGWAAVLHLYDLR